MWSPTDLPCRTSTMQEIVPLDQNVVARSSSPRLFRLLRRATLALSLPTALLVGAVVPTAQSVVVEPATVTASVQVIDRSTAEGSLSLGAPRTLSPTVGTVTAYALNLRAGPGTNYRILTSLSRGMQGTVLSSASGWYRISTSRGSGWVLGTFFRVGGTAASAPAPSSNVVAIAQRYIGYPYVWGATGPNAFDCSGFTQYVYRLAGITLAGRTAAQQYNTAGTRIRSYSNLQPGDLIFFANTYAPGITHVGVYAGNGQMIDAANPRAGVRYVNINQSYYTSRFAGGIRPYR